MSSHSHVSNMNTFFLHSALRYISSAYALFLGYCFSIIQYLAKNSHEFESGLFFGHYSIASWFCCDWGTVLISGSVHRIQAFNRFLVHSHQWMTIIIGENYKQTTVAAQYRWEKCWTMSNIKMRVVRMCVACLMHVWLSYWPNKPNPLQCKCFSCISEIHDFFFHLINYIIASEISPETAQLYQSVYVLTSKSTTTKNSHKQIVFFGVRRAGFFLLFTNEGAIAFARLAHTHKY